MQAFKITFSNNELIAMKFGIEIVCPQKILMAILVRKVFLKKESKSETIPPTNFLHKIV